MPSGVYKRTKETRDILSNSRIGKIPWNKGKKMSDKQKKKLSKIKKKLGYKPPSRLGYKHSKEAKEKISLAFTGKNHPNWQGGISNKKYTVDWTNTLRRAIRERDNYVCQLCNELQGDRAFDIHHIDYNKENCEPNNLITLCRKCHMKTNTYREYWIEYFNK